MYTPEVRKKIFDSSELQEIEWYKCRDNPYHALTNWYKTLDVHDNSGSPIKFFPEKDYIKIIIDTWMKEKLLLIPKSRQMLMSWLFVALYLWDTQFHKGRLTFFQSKKADDADALIDRAKIIWDNLPHFLKRFYEDGKYIELKVNPQAKQGITKGKMLFPQIYSEIRGIPEGGDQLRMYTASGILSDEMAFQPQAESAYTASKPTLSSGGRFTGVSTAELDTFFEDMVFDNKEV